MVKVSNKEIKYPYDANKFPLAPFFDAWEFECPCCKKIIIIPRLWVTAQRTRERLDHAITISNGCRCPRYQRALYEQININRKLLGMNPLRIPRVGYHVTAEALDTTDIIVPGDPGSDAENEYVEKLREDGWVGIGIQKEIKDDEGNIVQIGWTHLDVRQGATALWYYGAGRPNG